jgi:hypothetical protein
METTPELRAAIDQHRRAIGILDQALRPYRHGAVQGEVAAAALDNVTPLYEQSSAAVAAAIIGHLPGGSPGPDGWPPLDGDATLRLAASMAIDATVAAQAALLIQLQEPEQPITIEQTRALTALELADLGDLVAECAPLLEEIGGAIEQPPTGSSVATHAHRILDRAGRDVLGTVHALLPWEHAAKDLAVLIDGVAADWVKDTLPDVAQAAAGLRRLLAAAWRQVTFDIHALVGEHGGRLMDLLGHMSDLLTDAAGSGAALVLGKLLQADQAIADAQELVDSHPDRVAAAMRACEEVDGHHHHRRRAVPLLNKALPKCKFIHPYGLAAQVTAAVALLIYSLWLAHDHIDSPVLAGVRLPKNPGLQTEIRRALG